MKLVKLCFTIDSTRGNCKYSSGCISIFRPFPQDGARNPGGSCVPSASGLRRLGQGVQWAYSGPVLWHPSGDCLLCPCSFLFPSSTWSLKGASPRVLQISSSAGLGAQIPYSLGHSECLAWACEVDFGAAGDVLIVRVVPLICH